jgi:hypothetical protein
MARLGEIRQRQNPQLDGTVHAELDVTTMVLPPLVPGSPATATSTTG